MKRDKERDRPATFDKLRVIARTEVAEGRVKFLAVLG